MDYLLILFTAILADNLFFSRLFGVSSFFTSPQKRYASFSYGLVVLITTFVSGALSLAIYNFLLKDLDFGFTMTFISVLVINSVLAVIHLISSSVSDQIYKMISSDMPIISTNCIVLGSIMICIENGFSFGISLLYLIGAGIGFILSLFIFSSIRERLELSAPSETFSGLPILLLSVSFAAMAFSGFLGFRF